MLARLGCADQSFRLLPHPAVFALIEALELRAIDISLVAGQSHVRPEHLRAEPTEPAAHIRRLAEAHGLVVNDVFLIPDGDLRRMAVNHPDPRERESMHDVFALAAGFAAAVGSPGMTVLPGLAWPDEPRRTSLRRSAETLRQLADEARRRGLALSVEPHLESVVEAPEAVDELLALAPELDLTLDPGHFLAQGCRQRDIAPLLSRARHLHLRGARAGLLQARNAEDATDLVALVTAARERAFAGTASLEYLWLDWQGCDECDVISETVLLRDRLRAAFAEVGFPSTAVAHA